MHFWGEEEYSKIYRYDVPFSQAKYEQDSAYWGDILAKVIRESGYAKAVKAGNFTFNTDNVNKEYDKLQNDFFYQWYTTAFTHTMEQLHRKRLLNQINSNH